MTRVTVSSYTSEAPAATSDTPAADRLGSFDCGGAGGRPAAASPAAPAARVVPLMALMPLSPSGRARHGISATSMSLGRNVRNLGSPEWPSPKSCCWSGRFTAGWPAAGERHGYSPAVLTRPLLPGRAAAGPPYARYAPVPGGAFRARTSTVRGCRLKFLALRYHDMDVELMSLRVGRRAVKRRGQEAPPVPRWVRPGSRGRPRPAPPDRGACPGAGSTRSWVPVAAAPRNVCASGET